MAHPQRSAKGWCAAKHGLPRVQKAIHRRQTLFKQITAILDAGAVLWVEGPAGAGKTTLVASYLETRNRGVVWYQMDERDAEAPTFFRHLGQTLTEAGAQEALPVFDPRIGQDAVYFARDFFGSYFASLPKGTVVVFDDYHEVLRAGEAGELLAVALSKLPPDRHLVVICRTAPPKALARALAEDRLRSLGREALRLNDEEAHKITHLRMPQKQLEAGVIEDINRRAQGWVAGLVLLAQQLANRNTLAETTVRPTPDTIHQYFAGELFDRLQHDEMDSLVALSFLPNFTADAAAMIVGNRKAPELLDDLYRRNFFLSRRQNDAGELIYRLHPLFLDSLQREGARRLTPEAQRDLQRRAAEILATLDHAGEAVHLYQQAGAWEEAEALVREQAPQLLARGEYRTLQSWLQGIPEERIETNAWLSLWQGFCTAAVPAAARPALERAYAMFRASGDFEDALLAWCGVVEGLVLEWSDMHPLDTWIDAFDELEPVLAEAPRALADRATLAMFAALAYRQPFGPRIERWVRRAESVFLATSDSVVRVFLASHLSLYYGFMRGQFGRAGAFVGEIGVREDDDIASALAKIVFQTHHAVIDLWNSGDYESSLRRVQRGLDVAERSGVHSWDFFLHAVGAWTSLSAADYEQADYHVGKLGQAFNHQAPLNRCVFHDTSAILALHRDKLDSARAQSRLSLELARRGGMPYAEAACLLTASRVCSHEGDLAGAERIRRQAERIARAMDNRFVLNHLLWFEAADRLHSGGAEAALEPLREVLAAGRAGRFVANLWLKREDFSRLCHAALSHGIEVDYVRQLVAMIGLPALEPAWADAGWPYRLRVEALSGGRMEVLTDAGYRAEALQGRGGQLLEALAWLGGDRVSQEQLADILWPEADGDAARRSFDTTLHRLRRALGDERLLLLAGGRLSLHSGLTWTDVGAVHETRAALSRALRTDAPPAELEKYQARLIERATPLFVPITVAPVFVPLQMTLRREVAQTLEVAGLHWQKQKAWPAAIRAFEAGLRLNPVSETAYLHLMRIHVARGLPAEAMTIYQRCRDAIRAALDITPGPEVEAVRRQLATASRER